MQLVQQIIPISDLRVNQLEVLALADEAPVILSQHSRARAVLVSVPQWDAIAQELRNLRLLVEAKRIEAETADDEWVSEEELERLIATKGNTRVDN